MCYLISTSFANKCFRFLGTKTVSVEVILPTQCSAEAEVETPYEAHGELHVLVVLRAYQLLGLWPANKKVPHNSVEVK